MTHLLVTNDFPPKIGGIQSYLYELWRRLPADRFAVLTIDHEGAASFDERQDFRIRRLSVPMLHPKRAMRKAIESYAAEIGATHVVLDPVFPIGLIGPRLSLPYSLIVHGAEIRVPGHLPVLRRLMRRSISGAELIIAAGDYPARETRRISGADTPEVVVIPPGVDINRFHPFEVEERRIARSKFGVSPSALCVVSVSRLVPRKGFDVLIKGAAKFHAQFPTLEVVIGGAGRDLKRLERLVERYRAPVRFLGLVDEADLADLYGCGDIVAMVCRDRWFGLEQEGFGIVFLEAAAAGVATIAGASGGAGDAVTDESTGIVVRHPSRPKGTATALARLLTSAGLRHGFGVAGRARVETDFDYDVLAERLSVALARVE